MISYFMCQVRPAAGLTPALEKCHVPMWTPGSVEISECHKNSLPIVFDVRFLEDAKTNINPCDTLPAQKTMLVDFVTKMSIITTNLPIGVSL